jgi:hypothetical protein
MEFEMTIRHDEELFALRDAAKFLPLRRCGKQAHPVTLTRWAARGLRGVKLEVLRIGGTLYTTKEALQRFFEALTKSGEKPNDLQAGTVSGQAS